MTNLVVILDDVEVHMFMCKCLYTTIHTINIYTFVSGKKIKYIYLNIQTYMKVLNVSSVFAKDVGKAIFPSYPAAIQGCRKPTIIATKDWKIWVNTR